MDAAAQTLIGFSSRNGVVDSCSVSWDTVSAQICIALIAARETNSRVDCNHLAAATALDAEISGSVRVHIADLELMAAWAARAISAQVEITSLGA